MMIFLNGIEEEPSVPREVFETLLKFISPFAPHIAEELWQRLGHEGTIFNSPWPKYDEEKTIEEVKEFTFQVDNKIRDKQILPVSLTQEELLNRASASASVQNYIVSNNLMIDQNKFRIVPGKHVLLYSIPLNESYTISDSPSVSVNRSPNPDMEDSNQEEKNK